MVVVVADPPRILDTESRVVADEPRIWGDVRENAKDEFVRQFEDCENGIEKVNILSRNQYKNSY